MNDLTDEELMVMFQYGDLDAFSLLFEKYKEALWRYLYHMCNNPHTAEDLLQEVFMKIVKYAKSYRFEGKLSSWFYKIASNHYLNYRSSNSYKNIIYLKENIINGKNDPSKELEEKEFKEILAKKIAELPEHYREIYILYELEGKKYEDIAEILDIPIGTVRTQLHRSRKQLMEWLKPYRRQS